MRLRFLFAFLLILTLSAAAYPDAANTAYKQGVRAESRKQYDQAFEFYKQAYTLKPEEPRYGTAYLRSRTFAAAQHVANGMKLRESLKLQEALTEFQRAAEIDGTNYVAAQGVRETSELLKKQAETGRPPALNPESPLAKQVAALEGPIELEPSPNTPITLRMTTTADIIYRAIGKLGGINVLFDLDYKPQKVTVELNEVMVPEALKMLALESKTFFLRNASTPAELQEVVGTLKGMLELNRIQVNPTRSSITIRGTPDQLVLAEKLVSEADKAKSEVVLDVAVMEVSRTLINNWGTTVPTSTTITPVPAGGTTGSSTSPVVKIGSINGNNYVIPLPSATFTLLMSDSHTKVLQRPQVRALDNEKATLKIGDRIPIATGSFAPGIGAGGISPLVNTQFTYLDVGVNIDITPHIHSGRDVTLKMSLEISTHTGDVNIGGISQPTIGQRRVDQEARLQDGEVNLLAGILEDSETKSLSGYPWLTKIPILKYLFGQENKERQENEIVFAITPHVVRAEEINDDDLKVIDVGTSNSIGLRYKESKPPKAKEPPSPPANSTTQGGERRQPTTQKSTAPSAKAPAQSDR